MNRIKEIKNIIEKKNREIKDYEDAIVYIDNLLDTYNKSVRAGKILSISSGILSSILVFIISIIIFLTLNISILELWYIIPLIYASFTVGVKSFINVSKNIEKEMNININELKQDRLSNVCLINCNKKDIDELKTKLEEANYILNESCINYAFVEDELIYSGDKEKVKILKLNKKI